jgi:type IV pilus assembly protein PilN
MRGPWIPVNLSSEPFEKSRLVLMVSGLVAVALLIPLTMQFFIIRGERHAAEKNREALERLETRLQRLDREYAGLAGQLRSPSSVAILDRSVFLNAVLQRKGVSWTRMFSDLEEVCPPAVRLVNIRPYITADNHVQLDMIVGAQAPEPVIELIKRFESSPVFGATALLSSQPPSQNEPLFRYRVSVSYAQKL